jgi:hypothetical protein
VLPSKPNFGIYGQQMVNGLLNLFCPCAKWRIFLAIKGFGACALAGATL